jgi:hypothetical protein
MLWIVCALSGMVSCSVLAYIVASARGLNRPARWAVVGLLTGPLALLALIGLPCRLPLEASKATLELREIKGVLERQREEQAELLFRLLEATVDKV